MLRSAPSTSLNILVKLLQLATVRKNHMLLFVKPFQSSAPFHKETNYLICTSNQMTGSYMKCNTTLNGLSVVLILIFRKFGKD